MTIIRYFEMIRITHNAFHLKYKNSLTIYPFILKFKHVERKMFGMKIRNW